MLIKEGKISLQFFLISNLLVLLPILDFISPFLFIINTRQNIIWFQFIFLFILIVLLKLFSRGIYFKVGIRSIFLGGVFSTGIFVILYSTNGWQLFGYYMCIMSFFHYSEFLTIAYCNPKTLSISSFLINHSVPYNIAAIASWIEFFTEIYFLPGLKRYNFLACIGFILCIVGEGLRKTAMITGSTNFAHIVQTEKDDKHVLVTHGIYSLFRHPSYVGWFYWSIGTQVLLLNPICTIAYTIASWRFFNERIYHEEHSLLYFFGQEYMKYQKSVKTGLPGIKGFLLHEQN
ncbi:protein-S-isoprenylcysteine O-methyltransferase, putative [Pediculus humanus corporis]|uniref:Protein-S-isoprenylcysteine O-methyltransferase n=1 Tax=Pediculus humanus subsp. corporis TaxID=121224 RepID=E0VRB9_PEDHC|nr:protein-S-isoprenylcysteine O-methyltransferase, putative [Pediculus humanus corporis]EEB15925.1 protein-S-isoprenylcysteine O-methyltransferase, putative [Pediculus humanus corporis]